MIRKTTNIIKHHIRKRSAAYKLASIIKKPGRPLETNDVAEARTYIENFWVNLERYHPHDEETLIGLPKPYLVPAHDPNSTFNFDEMYYWDSYFMVQGLLHDHSKKELVMGILENLFTLLKRFKIIPNASRTYLMGRSQPPLLTSFIFDVYEAYGLDKRWLANAISYAKEEYQTVWMGEQKPYWHLVYKKLSRYFDVNMLHDLAEAESGWDMTNRFNRKCLDYLPIDLNSLLYKYETDFARAAHILGELDEQVAWENVSKKRKKAIDQLMWSESKNLYFDYNYVKDKRSVVASLASYVPMWTGMVTKQQAEGLVKNLSRFEAPGGLLTTDSPVIKTALPQKQAPPLQWAYPNGWAPLHFFVVKGLENYGYHDEARRIVNKWLKTNLHWFNTHGVFLEKYNVSQVEKPAQEGVYPNQVGFGWTNAVFERFCQDYIDHKE